MIKLTYYDGQGRASNAFHLAPHHIVAIVPANPKGALIDTVRGGYHVAQSADQVIKLMGDT
jgi:hypothetical protein